jgi:hypothetical protein
MSMAKGFDRKASAAQVSGARQAVLDRLQDEAARLRGMLDRAAPPPVVPEAPVAPARGPTMVVREIGMVPGSQERVRVEGVYLRDADVLSAANANAAKRCPEDQPFVAPYTPGQVAIGRRYRDLVERHEAAGMKCASVEARSGGGGSGGFIDAFVAEGREIEAMRSRIGDGVSLAVRRIRPAARGGRAVIRDRALVDAVCLQGMTLNEVLRAAGWPQNGKHREALRGSLCAALDRMQGYGCARPTR